MEDFITDVIIAIVIFTIVILFFYAIFTFKTKSEIEFDKRLKKSLADEYIIDPETGSRLTLEQAESGHWIGHDNEFRKISDSELDKLPTEEAKQAEIALSYLRTHSGYLKYKFSEEQLDFLEKTKILSYYDDWSYSNPFQFQKGYVFLPSPELHGIMYCIESYVMFWIKTINIDGHYFFREKTITEKVFDVIRNDDDLQLTNYECFTIRKSYNIILINKILENFENIEGLEIEINDDNLLISTTKLISLIDIKRIEHIVESL